MRWQMGRDMYAFWLQGRTEIACAMQSVHVSPWPRPLIMERKKKYDNMNPLRPTVAWKLGINMTSSIRLMLNTVLICWCSTMLICSVCGEGCWQVFCFRRRFFLKVFMGHITPTVSWVRNRSDFLNTGSNMGSLDLISGLWIALDDWFWWPKT